MHSNKLLFAALTQKSCRDAWLKNSNLLDVFVEKLKNMPKDKFESTELVDGEISSSLLH